METIDYSFRSRIPADEIPSTTYTTHGLYSYPAKFIPHVPYYVIKKYAPRTGSVVLDPFGGVATAAIEAVLLGHNCIVMDNNPIVEVIAPCKTAQVVTPVDVVSVIGEMKRWDKPFVPRWANIAHWVEPEFKPFISRMWGYMHANPGNFQEPAHDLLKVTALQVTDYFSNGARDVPKLFKSKRRAKQVDALKEKVARDPELPYSTFASRFAKNSAMAADFTTRVAKLDIEIKHFGASSVRGFDFSAIGRNERFVMGIGGVDAVTYEFPPQFAGKVDIVVTSPPYIYAQEYIRSSKAHLYWLGVIDDKMAAALTRTEIGHRKDASVGDVMRRLGHVTSFVQTMNLLLARERGRYPGVSKYVPLVANYFLSVYRTMLNVKSLLRGGGVFGLFVGNPTVMGMEVPCSRIFTDFFVDQGYEILERGFDTIVSRKLLRGRKNDSPDGMECEWLIVARKPAVATIPDPDD